MNIGGNLPAESLIQQIVLGGGGQILAAADHMSDAHQVVVHNVCKVVGRKTVPLQQNLIVQRFVFHSDITERDIVEGGSAFLGNALTDDIGFTGCQIGLDLLAAQVTAGISIAVEFAGILFRLGLLTEAVVSSALFHQQLRIGQIQIAALRLDIRTSGTTHIGTLVMGQTAFSHGAVNDIGGAFHQTALVGVLDAEDKSAVSMARNQPGVQSGAQIADMHITGGGGSETSADFSLGNSGFHLFKKLHIKVHEHTSM